MMEEAAKKPMSEPEEGEEMKEVEEQEVVENEEPEKSRGRKNRNARKLEALHQENEKLAQEKAEIHDKYIRLYSEFDNYRRRTQKEKLDIIKNASERIIVGLLPVLDDMERALKFEAAEQEGPSDSEKEGISLIYQKMMNYLKQQGLEEIHAIGEPFDVDLHEAVTTMPAPTEEEKGRGLDEIQKGYRLNEKVIRFSKVVIYQ
ncbi:MAG: nucleotide exchange factor GrpE [Bacteroidales bacterium]|nr:nucleotide exchange factor GrpE [Bacteroidales bacterium]